jgi:hypothetical protein
MKHTILFIFLANCFCVQGQTAWVKLKEGFSFTVNRTENSNAFIRYNESVLDLNYRLTTSRQYDVIEKKDDIIRFNLATQDFTDTVSTEGKTQIYSGENRNAAASSVQNEIDALFSNPRQISIDMNGKVVMGEKVSDSLSYLLGVYSGAQTEGNTFTLLPGFTIDSAMQVGTTWNVSGDEIAGRQEKTQYKLTAKTEKFYTVEFSRSMESDNLNLTENGVLLVDGATGFLVESNTKTISKEGITFKGRQCVLEKWTDVVQTFNSTN